MKTAALAMLAMFAFIGSGTAAGMHPPELLQINQPLAPVVRSAEQTALVADLNAVRRAAGLGPVTVAGRRLNDVGFDWEVAAENIALNVDEAHAHAALLQSPEHRANILDARVRYVGVAALTIGESSTLYVEDFAL